ncbi:MAG: LysR family transcriptional regulator [Proteobacteria bacterium]|nr:LysR family transcriptional regulator [Pseudomonadota bacterium]
MNKLEDMQTFIRIVEAGSLTRAAEQLNTVKSAISKRLATLEYSLGITLLNRTTRSQTLTNYGQIYYQQCIRIIDEVNELESSLTNSLCALSGRIKIAIPLSFGLLHLTEALSRFNEIHTQIKFDIDFNDRKVDIVNEGFDLAIRIGRLEDSSLVARNITTTKTMLTASQAYLDAYGIPITPQDLYNNHVNLQYSNTGNTLRFKDENNKYLSFNIPNAIISNNGEHLCRAAIAGKGIISTPDFICYKYVQSGQLLPILKDYYQPTVMTVSAIYPHTRHLSRRVRSLVDFLVQFFGDVPYWNLEQ